MIFYQKQFNITYNIHSKIIYNGHRSGKFCPIHNLSLRFPRHFLIIIGLYYCSLSAVPRVNYQPLFHSLVHFRFRSVKISPLHTFPVKLYDIVIVKESVYDFGRKYPFIIVRLLSRVPSKRSCFLSGYVIVSCTLLFALTVPVVFHLPLLSSPRPLNFIPPLPSSVIGISTSISSPSGSVSDVHVHLSDPIRN